MSFEKSSGGKLPRHPRGVGGKTAAAGGQDRDVEENHQVVIMMRWLIGFGLLKLLKIISPSRSQSCYNSISVIKV